MNGKLTISILTRSALLLSALLLGGCGGSGSTDNGRASAVSDSSETSPAGSGAESETIVIAGCEVDQYQAAMLEQVNAARASARSCGSESFAAAEPLTYNCPIEGAAQSHSNDMATHNFFDHIGSDGLRVGARVTATAYEWSVVGENIAAGYDEVSTVMDAWLDSPGHCENIMDPRFSEFAVARVDATGADYANYWTQVFAKPH
ncbi:CAP domain-containing protein [Marinobacter sp.]|uniref:CAP domain-containing protein n=1 Tax=Marinobacter sp. TaxID=50741 RepID=UPI0034A54801